MATHEAYEAVLAALCIWREARGTQPDAQLGVWWVIKNRTVDPHHRWPQTISGVVLQPYQFSSFNHNDVNSTKWPAFSDAAFAACCDIVDAPGISDPTLGANSYHSIPPDEQPPSWADDSKITTKIGPFTFYKL